MTDQWQDSETPLVIPCGSIRLEGLMAENPLARGCVVVTHPHPLYGGNMHNPVVEGIARTYYKAGFTTLRFNFRGTCGSSGMFDNGVGEQEDVLAVLAYLGEKGVQYLHLAGYSFGAYVNANLVSSGKVADDHVMVSPPVGFLSFDHLSSMPCTGLILTGENDKEIAPGEMIEVLMDKWKCENSLEVIPGGDHFYTGCLPVLSRVLGDYLAEIQE